MFADGRVTRPIVYPVVGPVSYGSPFNDCRDDCTRRHRGIDILASKMQPVLAMRDATVTKLLVNHPTAGNGVSITDSAGWRYDVCHLNNDAPGTDDRHGGTAWRFAPGVGVGTHVVAGQLIGWVGDSGNAEYSVPHVHLEIMRPNGTPVNPRWSLDAARRASCVTVGGGGDAHGLALGGVPVCDSAADATTNPDVDALPTTSPIDLRRFGVTLHGVVVLALTTITLAHTIGAGAG